jgi:general secretion pathway protein M
MMETHSFLLGRRPALIAAGAALAVVSLFAVVPVAYLFIRQHQDINGATTQISELSAQAAARPQAEAELADARRRASLVPGLMPERNAELAETRLQTEMKSIVESNGGQLRSTQIMAARTQGNFEELSVRYDLTLPITHLKALVYGVESHVPYLFVDDVDITGPANWTPSQTISTEPTLEIRWTIHTYRWAQTQ